jgi:hypothetical protein
VYGRSDIVHEAGQGQLFAAQTPARPLGCFKYQHSQPRLGEAHCGNQPVWPRAHDDGVNLGRRRALRVVLRVVLRVAL